MVVMVLGLENLGSVRIKRGDIFHVFCDKVKYIRKS
jgi:hypothetical protein